MSSIGCLHPCYVGIEVHPKYWSCFVDGYQILNPIGGTIFNTIKVSLIKLSTYVASHKNQGVWVCKSLDLGPASLGSRLLHLPLVWVHFVWVSRVIPCIGWGMWMGIKSLIWQVSLLSIPLTPKVDVCRVLRIVHGTWLGIKSLIQ